MTWLEEPLAAARRDGERVDVTTKTVTPLQHARYQRLRSQTEVAALVGVSRQTISSLENGRSRPSVMLATALARALGTSLELLWG